MQWFLNLKTLWKLTLGFAVVCAIMAIVGYEGVSKMSQINEMLNKMYEKDLQGLSHVKEANFQLMGVGRAVRNVVLADDPEEMKKYVAGTEEFVERCKAEVKATAETLVTSEGKAILANIEGLLDKYLAEIQKALKLATSDKDKEAIQVLKEARPISDELNKKMAELAQMKERLAKDAYHESDDVYAASRNLVICMIIGGVVLSLAIGIFTARILARSLARAVKVLETMAKGDFTCRLDVNTKDEVGQMARAMNAAIDSIRSALQETRVVADGLASAAQQLSAAAEEISSGAQEQASSLEETASSLEEITSTVKQTADNAQQANQLAAGAREVAEKGGCVVADAVRGMGEINTASKKIADIITAIDEIAFQTNLLALNAAVEAARAGEQGRGFAVVAAEVRNLAQRSAGAAKEIKGLIQDSVRKVETGSELVNHSGKSLDEIVTSVKRVTDIVSEIAAASREQSGGIDQVSRAVAQMDQVTQANASQTEELSGTAEGLSAQAEQLQALVARFKLDDGSPRPAAPQCSSPTRAAAGRKTSRKSASRAAAARGQASPVPEIPVGSDDMPAELELAEVGAGYNGHGGFEEF